MVAQADQLLEQGRAPEAIRLLSQAALAGNAEALYRLGAMRLEGRLLPRDLPMSRDLFRRSAEAGHAEASRVYTAFVANGTGGPSDWSLAMTLLRKSARKDARAKRQLKLIERMALTTAGDPVSVPEGEQLCTAPLVVRYRRLLTDPECNYLVETAKPMFRPSVIVDGSGRQIPNPVRTSETAAFPWPLENPAVHAINRRLAAISGTEPDHGEPLQVLRYSPGQEYKPHFDAVPGLDNQRHLTALVYLNDEYEGGETLFIKVGLSVRGERGDAILFRNSGSDGVQNEDAMHAGLPVAKGTKLIASRWIRQRPLEAPDPHRPRPT